MVLQFLWWVFCAALPYSRPLKSYKHAQIDSKNDATRLAATGGIPWQWLAICHPSGDSNLACGLCNFLTGAGTVPARSYLAQQAQGHQQYPAVFFDDCMI